MADLITLGKRGGKEVAQESAKTDGLCKGGTTGVGSSGGSSLFSKLGRSGKEMDQDTAPRSFGSK